MRSNEETAVLIRNVLADIEAFLDAGGIVVVEGHKDAAALKALGIAGDIRFCANTPTSPFCEALAEEKKEVAVLTDWDRRGRLRAACLASHFEDLGVSFDLKMRRDLIFAAGRYVRDVESLDTLLAHLEAPADI